LDCTGDYSDPLTISNTGCTVFQISNDDISSFVLNIDLDTCLTNMSNDCTWGDHIVLVGLANALRKTIRVVTSHVGDCSKVVVEAKNQQGAPILFRHLSENHHVGLGPEASIFHCNKSSLYLIYQKVN